MQSAKPSETCTSPTVTKLAQSWGKHSRLKALHVKSNEQLNMFQFIGNKGSIALAATAT